jgi:hypothetical protein
MEEVGQVHGVVFGGVALVAGVVASLCAKFIDAEDDRLDRVIAETGPALWSPDIADELMRR